MPEQVRTFLTVYLAKKSVGNAQNQEVYYKTVDLHRNNTDSYRIRFTINISKVWTLISKNVPNFCWLYL